MPGFAIPMLHIGSPTRLLVRTMQRFVLLFLLTAWTPSVLADQGARGFDVLHYTADITPDIQHQRVTGTVRIRLRGTQETRNGLIFDAGDLRIDRVDDGGQPLTFRKVDHRLLVTLSTPLAPDEERSITVQYEGAPDFGLEFHPEREEVYTIFSTSQWLVCVDAPDERATLDLSVTLPDGLKATGTGHPQPVTRLADGRHVHRWHLDTPMPSYLYGFAAGRYVETAYKTRHFHLSYLSSERSPKELERIFRETAGMLSFFGHRAGLRYRGTYTQALVAKTVGQELAGLSLMSEAYGSAVLDDPTRLALMAHEAAHQWWGNRLTNRSWEHFWLNEGFATFMAAAYLEHRFGHAAYTRQVDSWRQRLDKLRGDGKDRPLIYDQWTAPTADDRAVVYQKGAYVLHLLRAELGERVFWRGIRRYTQAHADKSVVTLDFQTAMERASGRSLEDFFREWVY